MPAILVVTPDVLADRMAGPAIRALNIATALAGDPVDATVDHRPDGPVGGGARHRVVLVSTAACSIHRDDVDCRYLGWSDLERFAADFDVVIVQGFVTYHAPGLLRSDRVLIVDLYDPLHLEQLEQLRDVDDALRRTTIDLTVRVLNDQAARGDFFLCASLEQRQLWLGLLGAVGRINPLNYDRDPSLDLLLAICPFGLPAEPPEHRQPAIRGVVDGISASDKVILWAGGVYNWFDPLTLLRAVARLAERHHDVRLFFMGMSHPNVDVGVMSMADQTRALAAELGLVGRSVFFNEGWVSYERRSDYLLEADVGVSTHFDRAETVFAFRTRILDYLWAGLPVAATDGDSFGRLIRTEGLGVTVGELDVPALADGLERLLYDRDFADRCRAEVQRIRSTFQWSDTLAPLVEFCRNPMRAPDAGIDQRRILRRTTPPANPMLRAWNRAGELRREGGAGLVVERVRGKLERQRARRHNRGWTGS